jgi:hypothetical protein
MSKLEASWLVIRSAETSLSARQQTLAPACVTASTRATPCGALHVGAHHALPSPKGVPVRAGAEHAIVKSWVMQNGTVANTVSLGTLDPNFRLEGAGD